MRFYKNNLKNKILQVIGQILATGLGRNNDGTCCSCLMWTISLHFWYASVSLPDTFNYREL